MEEIPKFTGFPKDALRFFEELKKNNRKEWFNKNKDQYEEYVLGPAQAFVVAFGERLKGISEGFTYDTRVNGRGSILRIHRDTRFSKDKTPYNTRLRFRFNEGKGEKSGYPGFFFGLDDTGGQLLGGLHKFVKPTLDAFREAVDNEKSGMRLTNITDEIRAQHGFDIGGEHYRRVPKGYDIDHPRAKLLKHDGLYISSPKIPTKVLKRPDLVDICYEHAVRIAPVHNWLMNLHH